MLTSVGKVKGLKVIARASVMDYRGARIAGKIREIGQTLGVSHVLEGSVRRIQETQGGVKRRVDRHAQRAPAFGGTVRADDDRCDFAARRTSDRDCRALQATLTPAEAMVVAAKPTQNPQAYLLYLRARETEIRGKLQASWRTSRARSSFISRRSISIRILRWPARAFPFLPIALVISKDRGEQKRALKQKQPCVFARLGEARLALTHCYLWQDGDYDRALMELTRTAELLPNSAEVSLTAAFIYKRQNKYRERIAALNRAEALDPRNRRVLGFLAYTYRWVRNWPEALHTWDRFGRAGAG